MKFTYDPAKNEKNIAKHGISFELAYDCEWTLAKYDIDNRNEYRETRYSVMVPLYSRLHNIVFTYRDDTLRIISFRKANARERKKYGKEA